MALSLWRLVVPYRAKANDLPAFQHLETLAADSAVIQSAARDAFRRGCHTPACTAVIRLQHIFDIIDEGEATTMGVTDYLSPNQPYVEEKRLHAILLDRPNRFGSMCALLKGLASR